VRREIPSQVTGWSGRHPRGRNETRRIPLGSGSACRSHAHSSLISDNDVARWRRDPLTSSSPPAAALPHRQSNVSPLVASPTSSAQPAHAVSRVVGCAGGSMLFKSALVLLITWLVAFCLSRLLETPFTCCFSRTLRCSCSHFYARAKK